MNTYEKCWAIRNLLLTKVGESLAYSGWSDEYKLSNIVGTNKTVKRWEKDYGSFKIDPNGMTDKELSDLGFGLWSEKSNARLIPIWLLSFLADEIAVETIGGSTITINPSEYDNDHRFGCLAYGVIPSDKEPTK